MLYEVITGLGAGAAKTDRVVLAPRGQLLRALGFLDLGEQAAVRKLDRRAVDLQHTVNDLDLVAGQTDKALDEVDALGRVAEHDDIAALRVMTQEAARDRAQREGSYNFV